MSEKTVNDLARLVEPGHRLPSETDARPNSDAVSHLRHPEPDHVYKVIELVGSSKTSIEAAIETAIDKAGATVRHLRWFEVMQTRGHVENGKIGHFQVTLKAGFQLED